MGAGSRERPPWNRRPGEGAAETRVPGEKQTKARVRTRRTVAPEPAPRAVRSRARPGWRRNCPGFPREEIRPSERAGQVEEKDGADALHVSTAQSV